MARGPDFNLPDEILSVIPTDPYDQLDLARKITSMAIASRVTNLENEAGKLRQRLHEKERLIEELQEKVSYLDRAYHDSELRLKIMIEDNDKLMKERDSLALTANKLSRDLVKLETFKRQLMESLKDENSQQAESVDIGTYDHATPKAFLTNDDSNGYINHHSYTGFTESVRSNDDVSKQFGQRFSITPYMTPNITPIRTPKENSTNVSPRRHSTAQSPQTASGTTSPIRLNGRGSLSSWHSSHSPPRARTPRIDGKEFFRQARSLLSLEQFSAFLATIKEFNAQRQSREETLRKAEEIFGMNNKDLLISFQQLLNRSGR